MFHDRQEQVRKVLVVVSAGLLGILLVWLTLSAQRAEQSRVEARNAELRTLNVLRSTDRVLRAMQNAETGQRGYLLTEDQAFLQPLRAARTDLGPAIAALRGQALDDPAATARVARIEELASTRMALLERSVTRMDLQQLDRDRTLDHMQAGKRAMDALRRELAALEAAKLTALRDSQDLARHRERLAGQWRAVLSLFTVTLAIACVAAVVGYMRVRREARDRDIRLRSNTRLEAGKHLLQSIIDSSQNAIFVKLRSGEILFLNKRFHEIVRQPLEELHGTPLPPAKDAETALKVTEADRAALTRGQASEVELQIDVDGKPRWLSVETHPWVRDDQIIGVIGIARDISDSKHREAELEQRVAARTAQLEQALASVRHEMAEREAAQESLRQLQKIESLGQLTGGIAHDFNNMLAVIINSLETMRRRLPNAEPEILSALLDNAMAGASSAAELTARLLAFARQQKLAPKVLAINDLVMRTRRLLSRTLGSNIAVRLDLDPEAGWVEVDASQLENALVNLAVNARDAMPGGGTLTISTHRLGRGQVALQVGDTGEGMAAEKLERVFDPFFTTKPAGLGTGLGLSQVQGFVVQSGGQIDIRSEPGAGTVVSIRLPRCQTPPALAKEAAEAADEPGQGETVLLVEDEALVRLSAQASLTALGYKVVSAGNGHDALALLEQDSAIAIMVTDIAMPGMNGRDLAAAARRLRPDLAVLLTTGHQPGTETGDGLPILAKPYLLAELARAIRSLIPQGEREQAAPSANSAGHDAIDEGALPGDP